MFFLYSGVAWAPEYYGMFYGVEALRRIDPSWNKRSGFLLPSLYYILFIDGKESEKKTSKKAKGDSGDDISVNWDLEVQEDET